MDESMVFPFCFPATFDSTIAGLEEAKSLAGEKSSDGFRSFSQILRKIPPLVKPIRRNHESPLPVPQKQSALHPHARFRSLCIDPVGGCLLSHETCPLTFIPCVAR